MSKFQERLKIMLAAKRMTQAEMAKIIEVTPGTLSAYLREDEKRKTPNLDTLERIAQKLNVSVGWLCGENDINSIFLDPDLSYAKIIKVINQLIAIDGGLLFTAEISSTSDTFALYSHDKTLIRFYNDYMKVMDLYKSGTIDDEMRVAWIEKRFKDMEGIKYDGLPF